MTRREVPHPQPLPGRTLGIVVDDIEGDVVDIGARSTKVLTNDNITIIVPNSKPITENVVNWKYNDASVRLNGIEIPFQQRDLHIRSGLIGVEMVEP